MIVVDASALLEFLLQTPLGTRVEARFFRDQDEFHSWKLRENITAYGAMYVALAEALDAPVMTCDTPLAKVPGHRAQIEAIE